ncbi:hypothetical protein [Hymenobacter sedentarius]|uniref:hypothetical protein n=1 Tax=Hymenobacter sedentarius TaxID=1411621 RepID=UPI000A6B81D9|nr:hypothetical protein [Hymenobacter sedentarius]
MSRLPALAAFFIRGRWCALALAAASCTGPNTPGAPAPEWASDSASVRVAAGPQYARGAAWRFFWGTHYRDIWATPVTAPVLRLATVLPGGLTPTRAGGSYQSHTLRLCTDNGREFVLRSVDKDASTALPAGWKRRVLGRLMKDQTSAGQPYGAYVAAQLAEAVGVYHTNPQLIFLPNDRHLGKFRDGYANALYLLEERPEGNQHALATFGYSPDVVSSRHMLAAIHLQPTAQVEARAYLRARLLDMWLGDWSRREDQWRWASFPQPGRITYRPIPRDRDQAFFLFDDGLITRLVSWFVPKYHSFHATIRPSTVDGLTTTARALDRTLLGTLNAADFRQQAEAMRARLTDAVIANALKAGPTETRDAIAARLGPLLRARREQLPELAQRYYQILAGEAWVVGTDQAERFVISAAGPGALRVSMYARHPAKPDSLISERVYNRKETYQVNVYGLAGDDIFELVPPLKSGQIVNIFDGAGHDQLVNPAQTLSTIENITWYSSSDGNASRNNTGLIIKPNPDAQLTSNSLNWLRRYNLHD